MRVTTLKGVGAGDYYLEGGGLPGYYLDVDEPRGVWFGVGAEWLFLDGEVDDEQFSAVMAGVDPYNPDRLLGRALDEGSVRGFDVTASAPKSVSVLFALGDDWVRREVLAAHDLAVAAMAGWIEAHAHTRFRIAGEVAVVDADGIVAATFRQHTSRALDPQLHTHLVIANRVRSPDGRWLALDARTIKRDQRTLSVLYHAGLRAELTRRLGVRWEHPVNGIAEIVDVADEVMAEFCSRSVDVEDRVAVKLDRFADTVGREPTPRERWRIEREAVIDSRPAKTTGVDAAALHVRWREQVEAIGVDPDAVVADAIGRVEVVDVLANEVVPVADAALVKIGLKQSTWRPAELAREVAANTPTTISATARQVVEWVDEVAREVETQRCVDISRPVPPGVRRRRDGRPVTESATDRALTTQLILDQEHALIDWAEHRTSGGGIDDPAAVEHTARELTRPQSEAAAAVAGDRRLVVIVGPAGTGKTTALDPAVRHLRMNGRAVFGVAPSAAAAKVLAMETGVDADTIDKLLIEHDPHKHTRRDQRFDLPAGATVIVDEAGMVSTPKLARLAALADQHQWRVVLVGDPMQFSSVDRGGMFTVFTTTFDTIELDQVHRFTHRWERDASLQLRAGNPDISAVYDTHGRLHGGTPAAAERDACHHWHTERQLGRTVLLMAPTNETAHRLNERCQQLRIRTGELDPDGPHINTGRWRFHVGDEIATRQNDRRLRTDRGDMIRNRATWTITAIHAYGALTARGDSGTVTLPADYVSDHVDLAYAHTAMATQGRTVDTGILYTERPCDARTLYVAMTRGRHANHAWLSSTTEATSIDIFERSATSDWIDRPAVVRHAELHPTPEPPSDDTVLVDAPAAPDTPISRRHARARTIVNDWTKPPAPPRLPPPDLTIS